ncbi:MAG: hypothetical protein ACI9R3_006479, partial [Verrucomicrobiales bacterium]
AMIRCILFLAICCMCAGAASAQGTAEKAVAALFAAEPDGKKQGKDDAGARLYFALTALEQRFLDAGNFKRAAIVREAVTSVEVIHGSFAAKAAPEARIGLKPDQASTTGAIRLDRGQGILVGWKNQGNSAQWDILTMEPGRYDVLAHYSVSDGQSVEGMRQRAGGSFIFRQEGGLSGLSGGQTERITHRVVSTGGWDKFSPVNIGQMEFTRTSSTVVIECATAEELGVMHLKGLELRKLPRASVSELAEQFAALQAAHVREVDSLIAPLEQHYLENLRQLKSSPKTKTEIERIQKAVVRRNEEQGSDAIRSSDVAEVRLSATNHETMSLSGQAVVHSSGEFVTGLRPPGAYVQWSLNRHFAPPGDYEVAIEFRTSEKMGGAFRILCGAESLTSRVRMGPFGSLNRDFRRQRVGRLRIPVSARNIRFEPQELEVRDGMLCDLRSLTLTPLSAVKRITKHADSYVEWRDATFFKRASNTGNRFAVRHLEKIHVIQLYAVICPPGSTKETRTEPYEKMKNHFGVSANDLARGGRQAAQLSEEALSGKSFSIFTAGKKNESGALWAWVLVDKDSLLSGRLVEKGLAEIDGELAAVPSAICTGINGARHQVWLRAREKEASDAKEGLWRYRRE